MNIQAKRIAAILFAAALAGALAGCGSQQSSSSASSSASTSSSASASSSASSSSASADGTIDPQKAYDEIANLLADSAGYSTVTLTQTNTTTAKNASTSEPLVVTTVYKFDISGDASKATISTKIDNSSIVYYVDGDKVVADCDGTVYGGTVKEFGVENLVYPAKVIESGAGELADLGKCITSATTGKVDGDTVYTLAIDPKKYAEVSETFAATQKVLNTTEVGVAYVFGSDNKLKAISYSDSSDMDTTTRVIEFSDYDATTLETAPEATKTYQDFVAAVQAAVKDAVK